MGRTTWKIKSRGTPSLAPNINSWCCVWQYVGIVQMKTITARSVAQSLACETQQFAQRAVPATRLRCQKVPEPSVAVPRHRPLCEMTYSGGAHALPRPRVVIQPLSGSSHATQFRKRLFFADASLGDAAPNLHLLETSCLACLFSPSTCAYFLADGEHCVLSQSQRLRQRR